MREPRIINTVVAMSTPSTQILVSKYRSYKKEPGLLGEMVDSRAEVGKFSRKFHCKTSC